MSPPRSMSTAEKEVSDIRFTDTPAAGTYTYMVRAIKLETSAGGTYFNPSQGICVTTSDPAAQR